MKSLVALDEEAGKGGSTSTSGRWDRCWELGQQYQALCVCTRVCMCTVYGEGWLVAVCHEKCKH